MRVLADDARFWALQRAVIALGLALRLAEYLHNDSLWGDEAMLSLSIASRSFHQLLGPLGYGQVASVPFLWAERLMVELFGINEWALRLLPLIAGSAVCVVVALVARRMLRPEEALVAVVLVAFSQTLIRYSAEVKPYAIDALVAVATAGAAAALLERMDSPGRWWRLAALGAGAIVVSLTSAFVCLAVGLALLVQALRERRMGLLPRLGLLGLAWAALYALIYATFYRPAANASYMRSFWEGAFLVPGTPNLLARTRVAIGEVLWGIDPGTALCGLGFVTLAMILLGAIALWRRGQAAHAILLVVPGLAPFAASTVGIYPIATRLMLFVAPLSVMLAGVGMMVAGKSLHRLAPRLPTRWVLALLLLPAVSTALAWALAHGRDQQMRPLVHSLRGHWQPGDAVYVFHRVIPAWLFYSTDWSAPNLQQLAWAMELSGPGGPSHENGPARGPRPPGEGSELAYQLDGHRVLLGTSSGIQGRPMFGYLPGQPDEGWVNNEGHRMQSAAGRVWLVLGNTSYEGVDLGHALKQEAKNLGGRLSCELAGEDPAAYLFTFVPGPSRC
ncbi:MAG TPA: glycosyltransferase family 39 protein [Gemmatimonadales bacterium]|nr:glycosyltransferase family 39 protein [Gemmatimonadales bacterium]